MYYFCCHCACLAAMHHITTFFSEAHKIVYSVSTSGQRACSMCNSMQHTESTVYLWLPVTAPLTAAVEMLMQDVCEDLSVYKPVNTTDAPSSPDLMHPLNPSLTTNWASLCNYTLKEKLLYLALMELNAENMFVIMSPVQWWMAHRGWSTGKVSVWFGRPL